MNGHCGADYETCDWSPGPGNVHFNQLGFAALAQKMAGAIKTLTAPAQRLLA